MVNGRPSIVGDDVGPTAPYPLTMEGKVISGFGRGSKEVSFTPFHTSFRRHTDEINSQLGIPTANLPVDSSVTPWIDTVPSGVYFGYASLFLSESGGSPEVFPMVMSIGYNPFYKNTVRSAEVHVLHKFEKDFYDKHMRLLVLGFVREEQDYKSLEALVEDINFDCEVAKGSLRRPGWRPKGIKVVTNEDEEGILDGSWLVRPLE